MHNLINLRTSLLLFAAVGGIGCGAEPMVPEGDVLQTISALTGVHRVCRYSSIRRDPGGQVFDCLSAGENFNIYRHCGRHSNGSYCAWYYGHAYGHVHEDGWISENAFDGC